MESASFHLLARYEGIISTVLATHLITLAVGAFTFIVGVNVRLRDIAKPLLVLVSVVVGLGQRAQVI